MHKNNNIKNAKEHIEDVYGQLVQSKGALSQALDSVEKNRNKKHIQNNIASVQDAINSIDNTLNNYKE